MKTEEPIDRLKAHITRELKSIPECVINGGAIAVKEYKHRVEVALRLLRQPRAKAPELENALFLLRNIDKYSPTPPNGRGG